MSSFSRQNADGSNGGGGYSIPSALHALTTDNDGMLTYTRTPYNGSNTENMGANFNTYDSFSDFVQQPFSNFDSNVDDYDIVTGHKLGSTRFDQYIQGSDKVYYYIDADGNLCVRTNATYTYNGPV
jgi:hypothetical protein